MSFQINKPWEAKKGEITEEPWSIFLAPSYPKLQPCISYPGMMPQRMVYLLSELQPTILSILLLVYQAEWHK